jgi:hypothetical protein
MVKQLRSVIRAVAGRHYTDDREKTEDYCIRLSRGTQYKYLQICFSVLEDTVAVIFP